MTSGSCADSHRFPRCFRIRKRPQFLNIQREGRRKTTAHFVIFMRGGVGFPRLGITTSRKVGSAPKRNRVRRLIREFFRRHRDKFPGTDVLVIARPDAASIGSTEVFNELRIALYPPGDR